MTALARHPGRLVVMGVLNVTPDSFSDGGRYLGLDDAVAHGIRLRDDGADLVDVGGESTRPGAERVDADEEIRRVVPVIGPLAAAGVTVSIDTTRAVVAAAALDAGALVINDVSGGLADPELLTLAASAGCPLILMHWRGPSATMSSRADYTDVVAEVCAELAARVEAALDAGVEPGRLVIDPGLGFAKRADHDWALLAALPRLVALGYPVLLGASRKSFLGRLLAGPDGSPRPVAGREDATAAITTYAGLRGAWGVRVHDVRRSVDAAHVVEAITSVQALNWEEPGERGEPREEPLNPKDEPHGQ